MTQGSFAEIAVTSNERAVGFALDSAVGDPSASELLEFLNNEPLENLRNFEPDFTRRTQFHLCGSRFARQCAVQQFGAADERYSAWQQRLQLCGFYHQRERSECSRGICRRDWARGRERTGGVCAACGGQLGESSPLGSAGSPTLKAPSTRVATIWRPAGSRWGSIIGSVPTLRLG